MQCVIVRDRHGHREFWGETGIGLDWLQSAADVWVYDSRTQAETVYRAAELRRRYPGARIVPHTQAVGKRPA